ACKAGFYDVDKDCTNGCECKDDFGGAGARCDANMGVVQVKVTDRGRTFGGTLASQKDAWWVFSFSSYTEANFHPSIVLTTNPQGAFSFDVYKDCNAGQVLCGTFDNPPKDNGERSVSLTNSWEASYRAGDRASLNAQGQSNFVPISTTQVPAKV